MGEGGRGRRWLRLGLAVAVSVVFSALFVASIDIDEVGRALAGADYFYVLPGLGLFVLSLAFRALRWSYLYQPSRRVNWRALMPSLLVGYAGNNLLPLRAGELLRAQHLADQERVPRMQTFGTLMMERLFDGFVLAGLVLWGLLLADVSRAYQGLGLGLLALSIAGFVVCTALAVDPGVARRLELVPFLPDRFKAAIGSLGQSFLEGFSVLRSPDRFALAAVSTAAAWGLEIGMYALIGLSFGLDASFITIAFAGAAANVALSLPSAQGGIGPFHVAATEALAHSGVFRETAAAYAIALHIFLIVPVSLAGLLVLSRATLRGWRRDRTATAPPIEASD